MSRRAPRFLAPILARPTLQIAAAVAFALFWALPGGMWLSTRLLTVWDAFIIVYFAVAWRLMRRSSVADIKRRAPQLDAGAAAILALAVAAAGLSFAALVAELAAVKAIKPIPAAPLAFLALTIALSWAFVHVMFALHYAHDFYAPEEGVTLPSLAFPGTPEPRYGDFLYFSFVIGCACATADVNIVGPGVRRLAAAHGVIAFFFNAAVIALSINIAAGLMGQ